MIKRMLIVVDNAMLAFQCVCVCVCFAVVQSLHFANCNKLALARLFLEIVRLCVCGISLSGNGDIYLFVVN